MPHADAKPVAVGLPIKGVDQGSPANAQPPGTCPDALNVRAYAVDNRVRLGKREGTEKAFSTLLGGDGGHRVVHLAGYNAAGGIPTIDGSTDITSESDDFTALPANGSSTNVDTTNYLGIYRQSNGTVRGSVGTGTSHALSRDSTPGSNYLGLGKGGTATPEFVGAFSRWATANDISTVFVCQDIGASTAIGTQNSCHRLGIMFLMDNQMKAGVGFRIERSSTDTTVKFQIVEIEASTGVNGTAIKTSIDLTIGNSTTWRNDLTMSVAFDGTTITCTATWLSQGTAGAGADPNWDSPITLTADVSTDFTGDYSTNVRAGFGYINDGSTSISGFTNPFRWFKSCSYTAIRPTSATATHSFQTDDSLGGGASRYQVPASLTSAAIDESGEVLFGAITGPDDTGSQTGDWEFIAAIDTSSTVIDIGAGTYNADDCILVTQNIEPDERYAVVLEAATTTTRYAGFCTRVSDDFLSLVEVTMNGTPSSGEDDLGYMAMSTASVGGDIWARAYVAGNLATEEAIGNFASHEVVTRFDDIITFQDDGTKITMAVNGMTVVQYDHTGLGVTDTNRTGLTFEVLTGGTSSGGVWVQTGTGTFNLGDSNTTVVAFTEYGPASPNPAVYSGSVDSQTFTQIPGVGLLGPLISSGSFARKIYAVDGRDSKIIDPASGTITTLTDTVGSLNIASEKPRLACFYRGRLVLARVTSNPAQWYMSRIAAPTDFDFGADPVETSAVTGTNADVGQPGDVITALFPFSDDFLIFGCGNSIWKMDGDPGYGGALQPLSYETGIVGPRAGVFDENGVLWFLSQGGLCRLMPGSLSIENVSGRRMARILDNLNLDTNLVQLAYDAYRQHVHILITPTTTETAGTHVVYDTLMDAFWLDQYPYDHGPFSVLSTYGEEDDNRRFLLGGNDGYVRRHTYDTYGDDGESINSYVRLAPLEAPAGVLETKIVEMHAEGDVDSSELFWYWLTAESADAVNQVSNASPTNNGSWTFANGFTTPVRLRQRSPVHQLYVAQSGTVTWALERITVFLAPGGRRR